jgi:hypothetical protein
LTLHTIDTEARLHRLAECLGYSKSFDKRKLSKRKEAELLRYGILATMERTSTKGSVG